MSLYPVQDKARVGRSSSATKRDKPVKVEEPEPAEEDVQFSFDDVMREPLLCGAFHKHLKESFCDESLLCYKEVEYFQSQCQRLTRLERFQYGP